MAKRKYFMVNVFKLTIIKYNCYLKNR
jgi:hypothetical protein